MTWWMRYLMIMSDSALGQNKDMTGGTYAFIIYKTG